MAIKGLVLFLILLPEFLHLGLEFSLLAELLLDDSLFLLLELELKTLRIFFHLLLAELFMALKFILNTRELIL